jgi:hypothetical protein
MGAPGAPFVWTSLPVFSAIAYDFGHLARIIREGEEI